MGEARSVDRLSHTPEPPVDDTSVRTIEEKGSEEGRDGHHL